ncbi:hypothetical protein BN77_p10852 [Rhizobium mesoamericanum STM3625]|uniref:Uncharacterized protein n=1 Tax=Rhizobium mesoamericanum STM3625 TaxID=1211777 RepID=K0Q3S2_9HYPH|nr:hypothetical protein BN77_p10852 [Rhizobium mesoamericanum STM3625]
MSPCQAAKLPAIKTKAALIHPSGSVYEARILGEGWRIILLVALHASADQYFFAIATDVTRAANIRARVIAGQRGHGGRFRSAAPRTTGCRRCVPTSPCQARLRTESYSLR